VYHDARQLEVLDLRQQVLPVGRLFESRPSCAKWKASVFLSKWLWYCVRNGYRFEADADAVRDAPTTRLAQPQSPSDRPVDFFSRPGNFFEEILDQIRG